MQLLHILLAGAVFGVVYGDYECFLKKSTECNAKIFAKETDYSFCSIQRKTIECMGEAGLECGNKFVSKVDETLALIGRMCEEGSDLNREMKKHKDCLMKKVLVDVSCIQGIVDFNHIDPAPQQMLKMQKIVCQNTDKILNCMVDKSRTSCGNDAAKFLEVLFKPSKEMQQAICEEVILPASASKTKRSEPLQLPVLFGPLELML